MDDWIDGRDGVMKNKRTMLWITAALPLVLAVLSYAALPDTITIHWGMDGTPNGFAPRVAILPMGAIALLLTALLLWAAHHEPQKKNIQRSAKFVDGTIVILNLMVLAVVGITISESLHPGRMDVACAVTVLVGLLLMWMGNYLPKVKRNGLIGARNRWTLSSDTVWKQTQRLSGWMLFVGGLLIVLSAFLLSTQARFAAVLVITGVCAVGSVLVSAALYRREVVK